MLNGNYLILNGNFKTTKHREKEEIRIFQKEGKLFPCKPEFEITGAFGT